MKRFKQPEHSSLHDQKDRHCALPEIKYSIYERQFIIERNLIIILFSRINYSHDDSSKFNRIDAALHSATGRPQIAVRWNPEDKIRPRRSNVAAHHMTSA